nr:S4 domain-containing protein [Bacteroidota bacterium]
ASAILFSNDTAQTLKELNENQLLQVMEGVPSIMIEKSLLTGNVELVSLLTDSKIFSSKGEARKMIAGGGVFVNKEKVLSVDARVNEEVLLNDKYVLVQKGKKNYYLFKVA